MDLAAFKVRFDGQMAEFLDAALHAFSATLSDPPLAPFIAHTKDLALAGGKRIRPYMAFVMMSDSEYPEAELLRSVLSLELFHLFALIHDDVMDGGEERHGIPTAHMFLAERMGKSKAAEGQAILLGDLLLSFAHQAILNIQERGIIARDRLHVAHTIFARMSREVIAGQMLDVDLTTRPVATFADVEKKNFLKTATYTFIRPMQFGVAIAGDSKDTMKFCEDFGALVGQAFQLQDDLLDVRGGDTGKTSMRDIREGQHTTLTQFVFEHGTADQKKELRAHMGKNFSAKEEANLRAIFEESKAFPYVETLITKAYNHASSLLEQAKLSKASHESLNALLGVLAQRTK